MTNVARNDCNIGGHAIAIVAPGFGRCRCPMVWEIGDDNRAINPSNDPLAMRLLELVVMQSAVLAEYSELQGVNDFANDLTLRGLRDQYMHVLDMHAELKRQNRHLTDTVISYASFNSPIEELDTRAAAKDKALTAASHALQEAITANIAYHTVMPLYDQIVSAARGTLLYLDHLHISAGDALKEALEQLDNALNPKKK